MAESHLKSIGWRLKYISRFVSLDDPEAVQTFITNKRCANSYKDNLVKAYNYYVAANGLAWTKPTYK